MEESPSTRERRLSNDRDRHTIRRQNERLLAIEGDPTAGVLQFLSPIKRYLQAVRMQAQSPPPSSNERRPSAEQDGAGAADALKIRSPAERYRQAASRILEQRVALNRGQVAASRRSRSPSTPQRGLAVNLEQTSTMRQREFPSTLEKHRADGRDREARRRQNMSGQPTLVISPTSSNDRPTAGGLLRPESGSLPPHANKRPPDGGISLHQRESDAEPPTASGRPSGGGMIIRPLRHVAVPSTANAWLRSGGSMLCPPQRTEVLLTGRLNKEGGQCRISANSHVQPPWLLLPHIFQRPPPPPSPGPAFNDVFSSCYAICTSSVGLLAFSLSTANQRMMYLSAASLARLDPHTQWLRCQRPVLSFGRELEQR